MSCSAGYLDDPLHVDYQRKLNGAIGQLEMSSFMETTRKVIVASEGSRTGSRGNRIESWAKYCSVYPLATG